MAGIAIWNGTGGGYSQVQEFVDTRNEAPFPGHRGNDLVFPGIFPAWLLWDRAEKAGPAKYGLAMF